ncbi:related to ADP-ribosyl-glycohydrolase [Cephalotrichum gorgonifer]|uniref:ADP-ribosylhydrolase ARH3 n=1 Tax=Cephalotrichum gorgonifer TaxID=2041049 RepID=A0AAE8N103_9PEZI|nr:related to ADP-ribosyl-glycohydrolase [Cephalotrichum gorgonifer]
MAQNPAPGPTRQSRIIGALLALHAGDSLGATVEFKTHAQIASRYPSGLRDIVGGGPFNWPAGHATDDTDLTRAVLIAYKSRRESGSADFDVVKAAAENSLAWFDGNWPGRAPGELPKDVGNATMQGLDKYRRTRDPERSGAGQGSAGNGSLMRCLPTGLFQSDPELLVQESMAISKITHNDFRCVVACAVYNSIVAALIRGNSVDDAIEAGEAVAVRLEKRGGGEVYKSVQLGKELKISDMAQRGPPRSLPGGCSGYVLDSLTVAIAALLDQRRLEDVLVDVVGIGRDTDTNAAIAGGLLGTRDGVESIPIRWKEVLQFGEEFRAIAAFLSEEEGTG